MWLFTQHGFYSVVANRHQPGRFLVRARVRHDLENLMNVAGLTVEIMDSPSADYGYRTSVSSAELGAILSALGRTVDYPNFKNRIGQLPDQVARLDSYHEIWATMAKLQTTEGK